MYKGNLDTNVRYPLFLRTLRPIPSNAEDVRDLEPADDGPLLGLFVSAQVDLPRHHERRHPGDQLAARHLLRRYRLKRVPMLLAVKISFVL